MGLVFQKNMQKKNIQTILVVSFIYFLILLLFFYDSLQANQISSQTDHLYQFYPWKSFANHNIPDQNHLLADQSLGFLPWYQYISFLLKTHQLPLWNPNSLGGAPLIGNLTSAFFYPLNWLYFLTGSDKSLVWIAIFKLLWGGIFTFLFLREIFLSKFASFIGGLVFMLYGFNILWLFHPHSSISVFLPCLLFLVEKWLKFSQKNYFVFLSIAIGIQFFGGHLETSFYILFASSLYAFFRILQLKQNYREYIRFAILYGLSVLIGLLLASCQLLPFYEYLSQSSMLAQRSTYIQGQSIFSYSLSQLQFLVTLILPNFYGNPLWKNYTGPENYNIINGAYIGILPLILAIGSIFCVKKRGIYLFFMFLGIFGLTVAYQLPIIYPLTKYLPFFRMTNTSRLLFLFGFSNIVLCAYTLNQFSSLNKSPQKFWKIVLATIIFIFITVDLFKFGKNYNPIVDQNIIYPSTETSTFLQQDKELFRIATPHSVFPHETHLPYNIASIRGYDALEIKTYTEFMSLLSDHKHAPYFVFATPIYNKINSPLFDLLNVKYFLVPPDFNLDSQKFSLVYDGEVKIYLNTGYFARAFLISNYVIEEKKEERLKILQNPSFNPTSTLILQDEVNYPIKDIDKSSVKIVDYQPNEVKIKVNATNECFLVLSDNYFSGWKAFVNEKLTPIYLANHTFRAVRVPKGESQVLFKYQPKSVYIGLVLSTITMLSLITLLMSNRFTKLILFIKNSFKIKINET